MHSGGVGRSAGTSIWSLLPGRSSSRCGFSGLPSNSADQSCAGPQLHPQEERLRAEPELGLRLALTIGRDESVQQALLDDRRGKR